MEKISEKIVTDFFKVNDKNQQEILAFGVQRFLEDITKILFITLISIVLGILKEISIIFLVTMLYKNFIGGAHAKTNILCTIATTIVCLFPIYFSKSIEFNDYIINILIVFTIMFSLYVIVFFAPADTKNIPIVNKKQRKILKLGAVVVLSVVLVVFTNINDNYLFQIVLITINISNLNTTPLIYKAFRCEYSNGKID